MVKTKKRQRRYSRRQRNNSRKHIRGGYVIRSNRKVNKSKRSKKSKKSKRKHTQRRHLQKGGKYTPGGWNWSFIPSWKTRNTLIPTPLLNLGRVALTDSKNMVNRWQGIQDYVSPLPTAQPNLLIDNNIVIPPNLTAINKNAQKSVINAFK